MKPYDLIEGLELQKLSSTHKWHVQGSCAVTGDGIYEGMEMLSGLVKQYKKARHHWFSFRLYAVICDVLNST